MNEIDAQKEIQRLRAEIARHEELYRVHNAPEISDEELEKEIKRSKAIEGIAEEIISNAQLSLSAKKYLDSYGTDRTPVPNMLQLEEEYE
jgi:NAD-dependent DNA ligase